MRRWLCVFLALISLLLAYGNAAMACSLHWFEPVMPSSLRKDAEDDVA